jgi:hypothetical protein
MAATHVSIVSRLAAGGILRRQKLLADMIAAPCLTSSSPIDLTEYDVERANDRRDICEHVSAGQKKPMA